MTRTQVNAAHSSEELRAPSRRAVALFRVYLRWYMSRHFHSLRVANAGRIPPQAQPLILFANHASWWDPLAGMLLAEAILPEREHYAPMDSVALEHYSIFRPMGFFPVDNASARGAAQLLRTGRQVLSRPGAMLWITPEGQFQDVRKRPVIFRPGLGALMTRTGRQTCVPVAMEYTFWNERLPEILVNVGEPLEIADGSMEDARTWTNLLSYAMSATLDELTMLSLERDPDAFTTVLSGGRGIGGVYELWKRFTCAVSGRPYPPGPWEPSRTMTAPFAAIDSLDIAALASLAAAAIPALLFAVNVWLFRRPGPPWNKRTLPVVSVLVPARDEELSIAAAIQSVLASRGVELELIVLDDGSTDRTAELVLQAAAGDARVRLETAPPLPEGWNGKQHACWVLAGKARYDVFCFIDADVRLGPEALYRMVSELSYVPRTIFWKNMSLKGQPAELQSGGRETEAREKALVSGFPRQETKTFLEWLLLPLIHFVLLGFLPLAGERWSGSPSFAAGCGQFLMARRDAYFACGGHSGIRATMHDGLLLPKLFRRNGLATGVYDLSQDACCRMYQGAAEVWDGLGKNATEGMASPGRLPVFTLLLLLGQVLPLLLVVLAARADDDLAGSIAQAAFLLGLAIRIVCAWRYRQSWRGVALHPAGVLVLLALQWYALLGKLRGRRATWKQREYRLG